MSEIKGLTQSVGAWVETVFGRRSLLNRQERAARVLEEAIELAQAEGLTRSDVTHFADHVYSKEPDPPEVEGAGVAIGLLAWADGTGNDLTGLIQAGVEGLRLRDSRRFAQKIDMKRSKGLIIEPSLTPYEERYLA